MIATAGILFQGKVYEGRRHPDIIQNIIKEHPEVKHVDTIDQGFVTADGKFLRRKDALSYALSIGQISEGDLINKGTLTSEDLW